MNTLNDSLLRKLIVAWFLLALASLACGVTPAENLNADAAATAVQQTVQAAGQQSSENQSSGLQPISPADLTATSQSVSSQTAPTIAAQTQPTATTQNSGSPPTVIPPTATTVPCDKVKFVKDVTVPDDTKMNPSSAFTKTWRLQNVGSCTWTSGYKMVFDHGDGMGGPKEVQLTSGTVAPGQTIDVSVNLSAPAQPGTYQGFWKLRNASGVLFGWGNQANSAFWVKIKVEVAAQQPPASSKKQIALSPTNNSGSVDGAGNSSLGFVPGDDPTDMHWTAFMDFDITSIPGTATIHSATLDLFCLVQGGDPFNDLGEVGVFYYYYGNFDPAVLSQGNYDFTKHVGSIFSCQDPPLDLTTSLKTNLAPAYYQIFLLFQFPTDSDAANDFIEFTHPTLNIEYTP